MNARLQDLLADLDAAPGADALVEDVALDGREVRRGGAFLAVRGRRGHGLQHLSQALERGARVVLWEPGEGVAAPRLPNGVLARPVANLAAKAGVIADRFFGSPSRQLRVVGITGTNGKTTCAYLLAQSLERTGRAAAYVGTIGWGAPARLSSATHTTPDAVSVQRVLASLRDAGFTDVAMEVSSHALDQGRVDAVCFHTAAFTNLSRDHLDYHGTMEAYGAAKARLFDMPGLTALVLNVGDAFGLARARSHGGTPPLTAVSVGELAPLPAAAHGLRAHSVRPGIAGLVFGIDGDLGSTEVATRLIGRFNAENALVVIGCLTTLGVPLAAAAAALGECRAAPGRMEVVAAPRAGRPLAVIDYAHTPDALQKALETLREHCRGRLWCVFGCGGDRDAGKRPLMGTVAESLADAVILTDDNPRGEDPQAITGDILAGMRSRRPEIIHDRAAAIAAALAAAGADDVVLIAGKGHEDYQIYGATRRSFSDRREAERLLGVAA